MHQLHIRNLTILVTSLLMILNSCENNKSENILTQNRLNYWEIKFDMSRYNTNPSYGYCFMNKNNYYAYDNYEKEKKRPYIEGLFDHTYLRTIKNCIRHWEVKDDSLFLNKRSYKIIYISSDSIRISTNSKKNPIIKLYRLKQLEGYFQFYNLLRRVNEVIQSCSQCNLFGIYHHRF